MVSTKKMERVLLFDPCPVPHATPIPSCGLCRAGIAPVSRPRDPRNPNTSPTITNDHPVRPESLHHHQESDARPHHSHQFNQQNTPHQIFQIDDRGHHLLEMARKLAHPKDHHLLTINVSFFLTFKFLKNSFLRKLLKY